MRIICLSRGSYAFGEQIAERLAKKLGFDCLGRQEVIDAATDHGIPVGKIEMAILRNRPLGEELSIEVDRFKAFVSATLCERAKANSLVYHGRAGHLVLPGLSHVLRVSVIANLEDRIREAEQKLNLSYEKAKAFNEQVDADIQRWVRALYDVDCRDSRHYDVTMNLAQVSMENAAAALVHMAQLPEFHVTPANEQQIEDLHLAARCRLAIGSDRGTHDVRATVSADRGRVTVTYPPRQVKQAAAIPSLLEKVEGVQDLVCTVASTSIAYVEEHFDSGAKALEDLIEVAEKWNAAVDLIWMTNAPDRINEPPDGDDPATAPEEDNGGILDDLPDWRADNEHESGIGAALERLVPVGRAGAPHSVLGNSPQLIADGLRGQRYSLIVVGDVFLNKGALVRKRLKRDLIGGLKEQLRLPVIGTEDLEATYLFGGRQWLSLLGYAALTVLIYFLVFTHQRPILEFLAEPGTQRRVLAATLIAVAVPMAAFTIGGLAHQVLKLIKLE